MVSNLTVEGLRAPAASPTRSLVLAAGALLGGLIVLASFVAILTNIVSVSSSIVQVASIVDKTSLRPVPKPDNGKCLGNRDLPSKKSSQAGSEQAKRNGCAATRSA
jgi:hypothetical protein